MSLRDRVLTHLKAERQAILDGNYAAFERFGRAKTRLFQELADHPPPPADLDRIGKAVQRNLHLLGLARNGVADTAKRLDQMAELKRAFDTYGADGKRRGHDVAPPSVYRKA